VGVTQLVQRAAGWLIPRAAAKYLLQPALALSPDGARVYALGAGSSVQGDPSGGSAGIFVFDARTLAFLDHWQPPADLVSVAVPEEADARAEAWIETPWKGVPRHAAAGPGAAGDGFVTWSGRRSDG
jgi:hypothetical protein